MAVSALTMSERQNPDTRLGPVKGSCNRFQLVRHSRTSLSPLDVRLAGASSFLADLSQSLPSLGLGFYCVDHCIKTIIKNSRLLLWCRLVKIYFLLQCGWPQRSGFCLSSFGKICAFRDLANELCSNFPDMENVGIFGFHSLAVRRFCYELDFAILERSTRLCAVWQ